MATAGELAFRELPSIVTRCHDVAGAWVAECIPLGVVTQGNLLRHALEMLVEAVDLAVDDDLSRGVDPLSARKPLPGAAEEFGAMLSHPLRRIDVESADESVSVVLVTVHVVRSCLPFMRTSESERGGARYTAIGAPMNVAA